MINYKVRMFARKNWLPLIGFFGSFGLALFFGFTLLAEAIYFNDPCHQNVELKGWMTPRYVVLSYDVPRNIVLDALDLDQDANGKGFRMRDIAQRQAVELDELTQRVRDAAEDYREANQ